MSKNMERQKCFFFFLTKIMKYKFSLPSKNLINGLALCSRLV